MRLFSMGIFRMFRAQGNNQCARILRRREINREQCSCRALTFCLQERGFPTGRAYSSACQKNCTKNACSLSLLSLFHRHSEAGSAHLLREKFSAFPHMPCAKIQLPQEIFCALPCQPLFSGGQ